MASKQCIRSDSSGSALGPVSHADEKCDTARALPHPVAAPSNNGSVAPVHDLSHLHLAINVTQDGILLSLHSEKPPLPVIPTGFQQLVSIPIASLADLATTCWARFLIAHGIRFPSHAILWVASPPLGSGSLEPLLAMRHCANPTAWFHRHICEDAQIYPTYDGHHTIACPCVAVGPFPPAVGIFEAVHLTGPAPGGDGSRGAGGILPNQRGLENGVPLATFYHAGAALLLSPNVGNTFGPALFEAESQWTGRNLRIGDSPPGTAGQHGRDSVLRSMQFRTRNHDGTVGSGAADWALRVGGPQLRHVHVVPGEYHRGAALGPIRLEGWDLLRTETPGRSTRAVVTAASNYRHITEATLRYSVWPIMDLAVSGASYTRFWFKFWLDWIGHSISEQYARDGNPLLAGPPGIAPAVVELDNQPGASDTAYVLANLENIASGDVFLHDMSARSKRSGTYAAFVRRYAGSWPQEQRALPTNQNHVLYVDQVVVPGAGSVAWLNGGLGQLGPGVLPPNYGTRHMLGLARSFLQSTSSHADCMAAFEMASAAAFCDPYSNVFRDDIRSEADDAVVRFLGRSLDLPICGDCTIPEYVAPFYNQFTGSHIANDLLSLRDSVLMQEVVYLHTALSQSHAIARLATSLTCDMLLAGVGNAQVAELTRKEGIRHEVSKFDRVVANCSSHLFGFVPSVRLMTGTSLANFSLGLVSLGGSAVVHRPQWIPQQWLGYEICEIMLMMPEGWAISGPGARFQCDPTKGAPARDRGLSTGFVRMFRSLPVLEDYQWLGDGGQARGASHICAGNGAHYNVRQRGYWLKPYLSEPPTGPTYLDIDWVGGGLDGLIVPGQFPVWDDQSEINQAWGLRIDPNQRSHELLAILEREADRTRTYVFQCRNGFMADDPTRVVRRVPELAIYDVFGRGADPGAPVAMVERQGGGGMEIGLNGELVAEANSMSDFVAGEQMGGPPADALPIPSSRAQGRRGGQTGWQRAGGRNKGKPAVVFRMSGVRGTSSGRGVSTQNAYGALADQNEGMGGAAQRAADAVDGDVPEGKATPHARQALQKRNPTPKSILKPGPSDDEVIAQAIATAKAEREQMQAAGAGSAPAGVSYADAVTGSQAGAAATDEVARRRSTSPQRTSALNHDEAPPVSKGVVGGQEVRVPAAYVAPPSSSSEDTLAALRAAVHARNMALPGQERPEN